jgi:hypothetical protein
VTLPPLTSHLTTHTLLLTPYFFCSLLFSHPEGGSKRKQAIGQMVEEEVDAATKKSIAYRPPGAEAAPERIV